jgi:hypothetical protein
MFLLYSCKNNPIVAPPTSDSELKSSIIGTWSSGYITIQYDANGNFQQDEYLSDSNKTNQTGSMKGFYTIQDGILSYNLSDWKIVDTSFHPSGSTASIPKYKIQIDGNQLFLYPLDVLSRNSGTDGEIWGEWLTTEWTINYFPSASNPDLFGQTESIYKFNKDSLTVSYGWGSLSHPYDSIFLMTDKIEYNPPYLNWAYNYHKKVEFHNGDLYLFTNLNGTPAPLSKIK